MDTPIIDSDAIPNSTKLLSKDRIRMFLNEYYFGHSKSLTLIRILTGPILIYMGIRFLNAYEEFAFAYFSILYGSYLIIKPLLWILFRLNSFKTVNVVIDVQQDFIFIKDEFSESKILFDGFEIIAKKRNYYFLQLTKASKMHLPFYLFSDSQRLILDENITH